MSIRKIPLTEGEYYHIYNRGNNKRLIFLDDEDRDRFVKLLYLCNSTKRINFREDITESKVDPWKYERSESLVSIGAWVLMPNHFHIYLTFPKGRAFGENNISLFMKKLCTSYSMYFNKKHAITGSLFEGRFKSIHIDNEIQAKYLFSYIHLNPIKLLQSDWKEAGIKDLHTALRYLQDYAWSSYLDYKNIDRNQTTILNRHDFINYFQTSDHFDQEILVWLSQGSQRPVLWG